MFVAMKRLAVFLLAFASFCAQEPAITETIDTREPIGVWYVGAPELPVRQQPNDSAPVIATYLNGEAISVLAQKGEWAEVRSGASSGWARMSDLTTAQAKATQEETPTPKFRVMPMPVSAPGAHGEIYIEADVNSDGEVLSTRILENTTGNAALAEQNARALRNGKFYPIVVKGERKPFKYYHKVTY